MKKPNINKLSKLELFEFLEITTKRIQDLSALKPKSDEEIRMLKGLKRNVRKKLFDCGCCADASIGTRINEMGEDEEYLKKDCKHDECLYHDYFYRLMEQNVGEDEKLINLLKNL